MIKIGHAWRVLAREQRWAALAAMGLFVSMFLPWYSKTDAFVERGAAKATQTISNAFQAFSFVEAAVLLVSTGVLAMLYAGARMRTVERSPHAPLPPPGTPREAGESGDDDAAGGGGAEEPATTALRARTRPQTSASALGERAGPSGRPRYPPAPSEQMSLEDPPPDAG